MDRDLLIGEFRDEIQERAEAKFKGRAHQAFLDWYIEAEFGNVEWQFTDDTNDGGIDALVWTRDGNPQVSILQSKFSANVARGRLARSAYRELQGVVDAYYYREETFREFLERVRDDLRRPYRKALDALGNGTWHSETKAFRLVTTLNPRPATRVDRIPEENHVYGDDILKLYTQYRKGVTPRARDLQLGVKDRLVYRDHKRGEDSYLFNARVADFRNYLDKNDVGRLVARNIRFDLGGTVGKDIRRTYESAPLNFWYMHNGITIICDSFRQIGGVATLVNPSVVNGAQTLYAISGSGKRGSPALVTTRVVVRGPAAPAAIDDDEWVQEVIRGVNTQNRVLAHDFRANEPEQLLLQNRFRDQQVFYERKRGEWKEHRNEPRFRQFDRLSLRSLGQILAATSDRNGAGALLVRRGVQAVFDEKHYRRLFPSKAKVARRFERIYFAYRVHRLLNKSGYKDNKEYRKYRHGFWVTLWLLHLGIGSVPLFHSRSDVRSIRGAFDAFEGRGKAGGQARRAVKDTRSAVWSAFRQARKSDLERWSPANFFKAKYGTRKVMQLAYPRVRQRLRDLGKEIVSGGSG